jgi:hypothetical protein
LLRVPAQPLAGSALLLLLLGGSGAAAADDLDDDLGGFGDEEEFEVEVDSDEPAVTERWWDIDGNVDISNDIAYFSHQANNPPLFTDWTGLARLRTRLNLQLDFELPRDWEMRLSPYIWYDFSYLINGRSNFTDQVIDAYEWEGDFQDSYLEGPLLKNLDLKIGRQVVNWGRSDSLRVLDVLNPLDNRVPGRADIEDLRWALGMAKLDWHIGRSWRISGVAIPEMRFDTLPPFGSDFFPAASPGPPVVEPKSFENWEWGGGVTGIFEGWDVSANFAYVFENIPRLHPLDVAPFPTQTLVQKYDRLWMGGAGGNYTFGAWLLKAEAAWLHGFQFAFLDTSGGFPTVALTDEKSRLDVLGGVEYYGFNDTTLALEVANRHIFDFEGLVRGFPTFQRENQVEYAVRYTADWLNARLQTTVFAVIFGGKAQDGAVIRLQGDYTLRDGLVATLGMVIYAAGELPPLSTYGRNDRVFIDLRYSF